jgi:bacteriocin biosynthesis cyclodehydratase domain-containing protein
MQKVKLATRVRVYQLDKAFYLQEAEKIYSLEEFPEPEQLRSWLTWLSQGIDVVEFDRQLSDKERQVFHDLLSHLREYGFLEEIGEIAEKPKTPLASRQYPQRALTQEEKAELAQGRLWLCGNTPSDLHDELERQLGFHAVSVQAEANRPNGDLTSSGAELTLLIKTPAMSEHEVLAFNRQAFAMKRKWLVVDLSLARYGAYGPLISPPDTPCYQCFCERRWINQDTVMHHALHHQDVIQESTQISYRWQYALMASLLVHEILGFFLQTNPVTYGHVVYVDFARLEIWQESLLRYPACPVCTGSSVAPSWHSIY